MVKAAAVQICSTNDVDHNLRISEEVVRGAAAEGAKVIFLPEAADFITGDAHECFLLSSPISSHKYTIGLQKLAKELEVTLFVGIHDLPEPGSEEDQGEEAGSERVYNTQVVISPAGEVVAHYRKLHLFDVFLTGPGSSGPNSSNEPAKKGGESLRVRPGQKVVEPVQTEIGKVGLEICYDIRFPELHTILTRKGATVLTFPSAFTLKTGKDHWATLLKSIAITFQVYVFASAQAGAHNPTRSSWGETLIYSPWGVELARLPSIEDVPEPDRLGMKGSWAVVEVDEDEVKRVRGMIPVETQKRDDVYGVVGGDL